MSVEVVTTDTVILTGMVLSIIFGLVCGFLLGREAGKAIGYCDRMDEDMRIKKRETEAQNMKNQKIILDFINKQMGEQK